MAANVFTDGALKLQGHTRERGAFILVGCLAAAVHVTTAMAVSAAFNPDTLVANFAGWCLAFGTSYLGNAWLTFRRTPLHGPQFVRFMVVSLTGLMINQALIYLLTHRLGWPLKVALIPVVPFVAVVSFVMSKFWAFGARTGSEPA